MGSNDEEIKLLFLLSGTCEVLPSSYIKLQSYLNIHLSLLADHHSLRLLKSFRNRCKRCPYCYSTWSNDTSSFVLLPSKKFSHRNVESENVEESDKIAQSIKFRNTLVLKCKVCTKKSLFSLLKKKPVKELIKEEAVESVKKKRRKKKKKDGFCGLAVKLAKPDSYLPENVILERKKRIRAAEKTRVFSLPHKHSQSSKSKLEKSTVISKFKSNSVSGKNEKFVLNPYAIQTEGNVLRKRDKKLQKLKQAIKEEKKNVVKNTLNDFLKLV